MYFDHCAVFEGDRGWVRQLTLVGGYLVARPVVKSAVDKYINNR